MQLLLAYSFIIFHIIISFIALYLLKKHHWHLVRTKVQLLSKVSTQFETFFRHIDIYLSRKKSIYAKVKLLFCSTKVFGTSSPNNAAEKRVAAMG